MGRTGRALLVAAAAAASAAVAKGQRVDGVRLGITRIGDLYPVLGVPVDTGHNDAGWAYAAFRRSRPFVTYYFADEDSVIEWMRVYPEHGHPEARAREAFGKPDTVEVRDDLLKVEVFRDHLVFVVLADDGSVDMIEYHPFRWNTLGARRALRADSVIADELITALSKTACPLSHCFTARQARDSVYAWRTAQMMRAREMQHHQAPARATRVAAARMDSLCTVYGCDDIRRRYRANDDYP